MAVDTANGDGLVPVTDADVEAADEPSCSGFRPDEDALCGSIAVDEVSALRFRRFGVVRRGDFVGCNFDDDGTVRIRELGVNPPTDAGIPIIDATPERCFAALILLNFTAISQRHLSSGTATNSSNVPDFPSLKCSACKISSHNTESAFVHDCELAASANALRLLEIVSTSDCVKNVLNKRIYFSSGGCIAVLPIAPMFVTQTTKLVNATPPSFCEIFRGDDTNKVAIIDATVAEYSSSSLSRSASKKSKTSCDAITDAIADFFAFFVDFCALRSERPTCITPTGTG
jgi:hypothetical protein